MIATDVNVRLIHNEQYMALTRKPVNNLNQYNTLVDMVTAATPCKKTEKSLQSIKN